MSNDGISRIRDRWFKGSPTEKMGVTERYVVYGEARRWMRDKLDLGAGRILDVGSGHGFLTFEVASRRRFHVVGLDFLSGRQMRIASGGAQLGGFADRISFVVADGGSSPFPDRKFDAVVSFNALQDVTMTAGEKALGKVIEEASRVLRTGGVFAFADSLFPECLHSDSQKLYEEIHREELGASLPPAETISSRMGTLNGLTQVQFDPRINLSEEEARIEFMDIVNARPFGMLIDFEVLWKKHLSSIRTVGLSYPNVLLISGRRVKREESFALKSRLVVSRT